MGVLTEAMLRSARPWGKKTVEIPPDTFITPEARRFAEEQDIELKEALWQTMTRTPIDTTAKTPYQDGETGAGLREKPEDMTHLRGTLLVKKTHPRIAFRGQLDIVEAELIRLQISAHEAGNTALREELGQLLDYARAALAAEVKEEPMPPLKLLGYDDEGLRRASHQVERSVGIAHPVPDWRMGRLCGELNLLRSRIREAELSAAVAFDGQAERLDLIRAMNRLSSAAYLLFCKEVKRHG